MTLDLPLDLPAPLHLLQTGLADDWDRRLTVRNAPAFAIIGEPVTLTLRIDDLGAAPESGALPSWISLLMAKSRKAFASP